MLEFVVFFFCTITYFNSYFEFAKFPLEMTEQITRAKEKIRTYTLTLSSLLGIFHNTTIKKKFSFSFRSNPFAFFLDLECANRASTAFLICNVEIHK